MVFQLLLSERLWVFWFFGVFNAFVDSLCCESRLTSLDLDSSRDSSGESSLDSSRESCTEVLRESLESSLENPQRVRGASLEGP